MIKELKEDKYFKKLGRWLPSNFNILKDVVLYVGYESPRGFFKDDTFMIIGVTSKKYVKSMPSESSNLFIEEDYKYYLTIKDIPESVYMSCLSESEASLYLDGFEKSRFYWEKHRVRKKKSGTHKDASTVLVPYKEGWFRLNNTDMIAAKAHILVSELIHSRCEDYIRNIMSSYVFPTTQEQG